MAETIEARILETDTTSTLVVEARDLDTDERVRRTSVVPPPRTVDQQRQQLSAAAAEAHPHATMRSFANGAATFLDRQHLIVAFYLERPSEPAFARPGKEGPALI